jgi:hypothetical protein
VLRDAMDITTTTGMRLTMLESSFSPGDMLRLKANKTRKAADFDLSMSDVFPTCWRSAGPQRQIT